MVYFKLFKVFLKFLGSSKIYISLEFVSNFDPTSWSKFLKTFNMCRVILKYSYFLYNVNEHFYCDIIATFKFLEQT